jgi:IS5 family transposase
VLKFFCLERTICTYKDKIKAAAMAIQYGHQVTFGAWALQELLDPAHDLVNLAGVIDWEEVHNRLAPYYSNVGRRGLPIRLMVGLHILKHKENMSDEKCADRIRSDLYWMYFCGVDSDSLKGKYKHLNSATLTKFRNRVGDRGFGEVENIIREYLIKKNHIDSSVMNTDSTCHPKNVAYPTDTGLLDKGRKLVLSGMKKLENLGIKAVKGVRTFSRRARKIVLNITKLGKDRQDRIKQGTLELGRQARHVLGKCNAMIKRAVRHLKLQVGKAKTRGSKALLNLKRHASLLKRVIHQSRQRYKDLHVPKKVYSLNEPTVIVIRKGKSHSPNEYGSKLNISTDTNGFIVNHETYSTSAHDSKLLEPALQAWEKATGRLPTQVNTDRGYNQKRRKVTGRIQNIKRVSTPWNGKKKNPNAQRTWFKRGQCQRSQIEGTIAHLKQDHRLDRCRYTGTRGDKINATLATTAWNLTKLCAQM